MQKKIEESGFKERFSERTSVFVNRGIELSAEVYLKTSDKMT